jgi:hypothetical protein
MTDTYFAQLHGRALVSLTGEAWRSFLQGLITNDVEKLAAGETRFAALLTPQGKFLFDMFVIAREDGCLLDVQGGQRDALIQRLTMYRLRAKVAIEAAEGQVWAAFPAPSPSPASDFPRESGGPSSWRLTSLGNDGSPLSRGNSDFGEWRADPRLPDLGWRAVDPVLPLDAKAVDQTAYDLHRLALGVPDPARDCVPDKTYPLEADFDLLNAIDFQKGCFIGQETTSRMKRRGAIKTRMLPVVFDGPAPAFGSEVLAGDLRAGEILSGRDGQAIALLRLDRIRPPLTVAGRKVRVVFPPWFPQPEGND